MGDTFLRMEMGIRKRVHLCGDRERCACVGESGLERQPAGMQLHKHKKKVETVHLLMRNML